MTEDLFSINLENGTNQPLADRMRPRNLTDFIGQEHILGPGKILRRAIEQDALSSIILYGPPGSGKTTLAHIISQQTKALFQTVSAVDSGVKELRTIIDNATEQLKYYRRKTILFVDECHAFNKSQQDVLLPAIEKGIVTFIGGTTENPYFEMRGALLSRSRVFQLQELTTENLMTIAQRALKDKERGLGRFKTILEPQALEHIIQMSGGDARQALNAIEFAVLTTVPDTKQIRYIDLAVAQETVQKPVVRYDQTGDQHYDVVSAFIKSIRGSDPDAALHWYARMTSAGENQRFLMRRLVVLAAEDIGLADPQAMLIAHAAWNALETVGLPEARLPIAQCIIYLARAPKSNSVALAIDGALADIEREPQKPVPKHLRDTHYPGATKLGHRGYLYPHNFPGHYVQQQYMPDNLIGKKYYHPSDQGREKKKD